METSAKPSNRRGRAATLVGVAVMATVLAACSSSPKPQSSGLPSVINVVSINELTGAVGPVGTATVQGQKLAVAEINKQKFLGNSKLVVSYQDTAGSPSTGAALVEQANASGAVAVLGSILSPVDAAEAPVAQRFGLPFQYDSDSGTLVNAGQWVWETRPNYDPLFHWEAQYLQKKGVKNVGIIYDSNNNSTVTWATTDLPQEAQKYGLNIVTTVATASTAADFSGPVAKLLNANPQAILAITELADSDPILLDIFHSGFKGIVGGEVAFANGPLPPLGALANGIVWPDTWVPQLKTPASEAFTRNFQSMFHTAATSNSATGYDQVWFLARAIKASGSATRAGILRGMEKVGNSGFAGALGQDKYVGRILKVPGFLAVWNNGAEEIVPGYGG